MTHNAPIYLGCEVVYTAVDDDGQRHDLPATFEGWTARRAKIRLRDGTLRAVLAERIRVAGGNNAR